MPGATAPVTPPDTSITVVTRRVMLFQCCTLFSCTMYASWAARLKTGRGHNEGEQGRCITYASWATRWKAGRGQKGAEQVVQ